MARHWRAPQPRLSAFMPVAAAEPGKCPRNAGLRAGGLARSAPLWRAGTALFSIHERGPVPFLGPALEGHYPVQKKDAPPHPSCTAWRALIEYVWIGPALTAEWKRLKQRYVGGQGRTVSDPVLSTALAWLDPVREMAEVQRLTAQLLAHGPPAALRNTAPTGDLSAGEDSRFTRPSSIV